jgi:hypothetical protein
MFFSCLQRTIVSDTALIFVKKQMFFSCLQRTIVSDTALIFVKKSVQDSTFPASQCLME